MSNARLHVPVDDDYLHALGMATFVFARLEWQAVWCCERIKPGFARNVVAKKMTAGKIGKKFKNVVRSMPRSKGREELEVAAARFCELVEERNAIMHGKPCTGPNGKQRLSRNQIVEIPDLEDVADAFAECGSELNNLYYGFLKQYASK